MSTVDHLYSHAMALFTAALIPIPTLDELNVQSLGLSFFQRKGLLYVPLGFIILILVATSNFSRKQRLAPGVPIVGGNNARCIKENRTRFIHDGKAMLEEGYRQVRKSVNQSCKCAPNGVKV